MNFKEADGNFWDEASNGHRYDALVCTINTQVKDDGCLVMGAGIAKQFAQRFDYLPAEWGNRIKSWPNDTRTYVLTSYSYPDPEELIWLVGFPTKYDWRNQSPLDLISRSAKQLLIVTEALGWNSVLITRPGCGHGGRDWDREVKPCLRPIFDERFTVIHNG